MVLVLVIGLDCFVFVGLMLCLYVMNCYCVSDYVLFV